MMIEREYGQPLYLLSNSCSLAERLLMNAYIDDQHSPASLSPREFSLPLG